MKRIFELTRQDIEKITKRQLIETIKTSEGRTVMAETVITVPSLIYGVSNLELAAAFGSDMVTLNLFDFNNPFIFGLDDLKLNLANGLLDFQKIIEISRKNYEDLNYIKKIKNIVGRFIGVNLEPVPEEIEYIYGRRLNKDNLKKADDYNIALKALELINQRLNILLPEDEAGFIALHLHAALENAGLSNTLKNARLVSQLVLTIESHLGKHIDRDSIDYLRLVTHLRFAVDRLEKNAPVVNELLLPIKKKFKRAYNIAMDVSKVIENTLEKEVPEEEIGYIAIHIQRLINTI
ncbi:MAG: BglG family transcription antiterminator [Thermoanaerobacteraceae bacterium]